MHCPRRGGREVGRISGDRWKGEREAIPAPGLNLSILEIFAKAKNMRGFWRKLSYGLIVIANRRNLGLEIADLRITETCL